MSHPELPGWYPDPSGGPAARHWNGSAWDEQPAQDFPEPEVPKPGRSWVWPVAISAAAVGAAVGATLLTLHWSAKDPPSQSATAATVTSIVQLPPPQPSPTEKAAADVKASMQRKFDTDPDLAKTGLTVTDVTLVHNNGNEYKGIATVRTRDGALHQVPVDVTADGANTLWETPPGSFLFAAPFYQDTPTPTPSSMPGADETGFFGGPRCMEGNRATLLIRTALSEVAICRVDGSHDRYSYNGQRLSDGAHISLPAQPTATDGFIATNSADGTQYVVSPRTLTITGGNGDSSTETVIAVGP